MSHRYTSTEGERERSFLCHSVVRLLKLSANHSQSGSYLNIDEGFSPLIKPLKTDQSGEQQARKGGSRRVSGFIGIAKGSTD